MPHQLKIEQIQSLFNCKQCSQLLNNPITLPCGITICEQHLQEVIGNKCTFCKNHHVIPSGGFQINELIKQMLSIELNKLKMSPKFEACKQIIDETVNTVKKIEAIKKDPQNHIYEYFEDIKRQVDLRREDLKVKIDAYSDQIIEEIAKTQEDVKAMATEISDITHRVEGAKVELEAMIKRFDSFEINDDKYDCIFSQTKEIKPKFESVLEEYQNQLIANTVYRFKFDDVPIERFFGSFETYPLNHSFTDSKILTKQMGSELVNMCKIDKGQKWKLVYRGSDDGFNNVSFHAKCDGIPNTLTIVQTSEQNIFGGYTEKAWSSSGGWVKDSSSYIFSLVNRENYPFVAHHSAYGAVCFTESSGPMFGEGADFRISTDANSNENSYSNFGKSYSHPKYPFGSNEAKSILAGSYNFRTLEVEIYCKD